LRHEEEMAWTETYHCDVCGRAKNEDQNDWWLGWTETISPTPESEQPVMRFTPWSQLLSHSPEVCHFCGARCAQTGLDRWMSPIHESLRAGAAVALLEEEDDVPAPGA
jgi:hypothetical protein